MTSGTGNGGECCDRQIAPPDSLLAPTARNDLTGIFACLARGDVEVAKRFIADIAAKIEWIAATGFTGVSRDSIRRGLRALPYRERCICFRVTDETVTILRILHSRQDVDAQEF